MGLYCKDCGYERGVNCTCDGSFERTQIVQLEKRVAELERKIRAMDNKVSIARGLAEAAGGRTS